MNQPNPPQRRNNGKLTMWGTDVAFDSWVLIEDHGDTIRKVSKEFDADTNHAVGFLYIDPHAGITFDLALFFEYQSDDIRVVPGPPARNSRFIFRQGLFKDFSFTSQTPEQVASLKLPAQPIWLDSYNDPDVVKTRQAEVLDPFRVAYYPDDIMFHLIDKAQRFQPEQPFARLKRQIDDDTFEAILLNQPHQNFGINVNDVIEITVGIFVSSHRGRSRILMHVVG